MRRVSSFRAGVRVPVLLMLSALVWLAEVKTSAQEPAPTPSPTVAPQSLPAPQKANQRPADAGDFPPEPFDNATVEKMGGQCVTLQTEAGVIELEMLPEAAPQTARNFLNLAATGFFDTTAFTRIVKDFVVQGGNISTHQKLTAELVRRARRTIPDEPNYLRHVRGIVSMARPEESNKATTHFFVLVADSPHLDGKFAAFARVTKGMEVVDEINRAPTTGDKPDKPVRINRAAVSTCQPKADVPPVSEKKI